MNKKLAALALAVIAGLTSLPAAAYVWMAPNGVMMSDTCIAPTGHYMTFHNQYGPVGAPCYFRFYGSSMTFYGQWS